MESVMTLGYEAPLPFDVISNKDGGAGLTSLPDVVDSHQPVKKQTRQWAAWTRQEEEKFFNALRQVGKNFEKIKCRVQSKNKDQVRHYYYRLVRRMNKLLGPGFSLDATNSKDTNAAMLRWWSLLEKYSCKASKLHLKPRRFKIFIEALEHQLLKDRKKNTRKRPSQNENSASSSLATPCESKPSGHDTRSVKQVLVDSQNIQKVASGKGPLLKRTVNNSTNCSSSKSHLSTVKTTRQRRKRGPASSAAYKKWEKAAIAGVSLVADAAEHLERTTIDKKGFPEQGTPDESPSTLVTIKATAVEKVASSLGNNLPNLSLPTSPQDQIAEPNVQPSMKLKLQLFPIDEATRKALEKDEHNPHLELTLRATKKIKSVMEHLNRKWGKSSIVPGELILFPYSAQREYLGNSQRWTQETVASAAEVYASVGSPLVFRLRYGWFSSVEHVSVGCGLPLMPLYPQEESVSMIIWNGKEQNVDIPAAPMPNKHTSHDSQQVIGPFGDQPTSVTEGIKITPYTDIREDRSGYAGVGPENNILKSTERVAKSPWLRKHIGDGIVRRQWADVDNLQTTSGAPLSAGDWADSLTNISMGELLTEASQMETDGSEPPVFESDACLQQIPFSCDSFDAAIAAHIAGRQERLDLPSVQVSHASSIWDAEETCDAFSFRKVPPPNHDGGPSSLRAVSLGTCKQISSTPSTCFRGLIEELRETRTTENLVCEGSSTNNCDSNTNKPGDSTKDLDGLPDIYWPDSLGPLDLDIPSSRYQGQDLIFGDSISLSGLNRLIANSLDAFQNCSFFASDKVQSEGRESAPVLDCKIGGEA